MKQTFRRMRTFDELLNNKNIMVHYYENTDVLTASFRNKKYKLNDAGACHVQEVSGYINSFFKGMK